MIDLDKIQEYLLEYRDNLEKANFNSKVVPNLPSAADLSNKRDKKMKTDKHMNGTNVHGYDYASESIVNKRVPKKVSNINKKATEGTDMKKNEDLERRIAEKKKEFKEEQKKKFPDPMKVNTNIARRDMEKEELDLASPETPKGLENKRKPVTHDECGRPFAKDEIDEKIQAKLKAEMDKRKFGEADATKHVIDRDRGNKIAQQPKPEPLLQTEVVKFDSNGQWSLEKSNYGPKGYGMYNEKDNIQRKMKNTGESYDNTGKNVNAKKYTTSGSSVSQTHEAAQNKKYKQQSKESLRTLADMSPEEKKALEAKYGAPIKKSEIEVSYWSDDIIEIECGENAVAEFNLLCKKLEEAGYESLAKKDWAPKAEHKSDKGGLTEAGRKSYNKKTGGNLKAPQPGGGPRKRSFCARNKGQIDKHNIDCKKNPDKRACKARRRWKC